MHMQEPPLDVSVKDNPEGLGAATRWNRSADGLRAAATRASPVADLAGYADGEWWVQDAAAALPARLLAPRPDERVLDMCAAPGGKTAQIALARARVVALDRSAERLKLLAANLARLGLARRHRGWRRDRLSGAAFRRDPHRRAMFGDRHDPPPSRRALDEKARRHRNARGVADALAQSRRAC